MIGHVIKVMRKQKGFTQSDLAKIIGISDTTISAYETGKIKPDFDVVLQIMRQCGYDLKISDNRDLLVDIEKFVKEKPVI